MLISKEKLITDTLTAPLNVILHMKLCLLLFHEISLYTYYNTLIMCSVQNKAIIIVVCVVMCDCELLERSLEKDKQGFFFPDVDRPLRFPVLQTGN